MDLEYLASDEGRELIRILADGYMCTLVHGDECINNHDCENCNYGERH